MFAVDFLGASVKKVYIAGPYTKPDPCINTKESIDVANRLMELGFVPFVPLLSHFWHTMTPKPYGVWLAYDLEWVGACDALLRTPGDSSGADLEVAHAIKIGVPVFYDILALVDYFAVATG